MNTGRKRKITNRIVATVLILLAVVNTAWCEQAVWGCPECGSTGNTGNYCGKCAHPAPWLERRSNGGTDMKTDAEKKAEIRMPYGLEPGMTVEQANKCMTAAGFEVSYDANEGMTYYYTSSIVEGIATYSTLMSVFNDGVTHVIHYFLEKPEASMEAPGADYVRLQSALLDKYGAISYSIPNGSDGWVNGQVEVHFGHLESRGTLYYVLAYWYMPLGIQYYGF